MSKMSRTRGSCGKNQELGSAFLMGLQGMPLLLSREIVLITCAVAQGWM